MKFIMVVSLFVAVLGISRNVMAQEWATEEAKRAFGVPGDTVRDSVSAETKKSSVKKNCKKNKPHTQYKLQEGIRFKLPENWQVLSSETAGSINNNANNLQEGSDGSPTSPKIIFSAITKTDTTYAIITIQVGQPSRSPSTYSKNDLARIDKLVDDERIKRNNLQGSNVLKVYKTQIVKFSGYPAIVRSYDRTTPKYQLVERIKGVTVFLPDKTIVISFNNIVSDNNLLAQVVGIEKTITIQM